MVQSDVSGQNEVEAAQQLTEKAKASTSRGRRSLGQSQPVRVSQGLAAKCASRIDGRMLRSQGRRAGGKVTVCCFG